MNVKPVCLSVGNQSVDVPLSLPE